MEALDLDPAEYQQLLEELAEFLAEQGLETSELTRALLAQDTARLERLLREAAQRAGVQRIERSFQEGQYSQGMQQQLGVGDVARELQAISDALGAGARPAGAAADGPLRRPPAAGAAAR